VIVLQMLLFPQLLRTRRPADLWSRRPSANRPGKPRDFDCIVMQLPLSLSLSTTSTCDPQPHDSE
jgi:hypothetical protein